MGEEGRTTACTASCIGSATLLGRQCRWVRRQFERRTGVFVGQAGVVHELCPLCTVENSQYPRFLTVLLCFVPSQTAVVGMVDLPHHAKPQQQEQLPAGDLEGSGVAEPWQQERQQQPEQQQQQQQEQQERPLPATEPMFCLERAVRLFYWTKFAYRYWVGTRRGASSACAAKPACLPIICLQPYPRHSQRFPTSPRNHPATLPAVHPPLRLLAVERRRRHDQGCGTVYV